MRLITAEEITEALKDTTYQVISVSAQEENL